MWQFLIDFQNIASQDLWKYLDITKHHLSRQFVLINEVLSPQRLLAEYLFDLTSGGRMFLLSELDTSPETVLEDAQEVIKKIIDIKNKTLTMFNFDFIIVDFWIN